MSERATVEAINAGFRVVVVDGSPESLWRHARSTCDEALAQDFAFVVILRNAGPFADEQLLNDEDRERALRFRIARDRRNFILGRTMVHHLVRPANAVPPCTFAFGKNGKPYISACPAYNLSHSGDWVACAVAPREPIGVDVETFERLRDYRELLTATTHPAERLAISEAAPDRQFDLFKRCWTRKEAVLKATGQGFSDDLRAIDVRLHEDEPLLDDPAPLRLVDLLVADGRVSTAVALDASLYAVIVMLVL